jgi:hypothetical protein
VSDQSHVPLTTGPPETILPAAPADALGGLKEALSEPEAGRRDAVSAVVARHPTFLDGWAALAGLASAAGNHVEAYAYARVGYHRGLDALRAAGWRGSGYVRWEHETNRGFLRSLDALRAAAGAIGETSEAERCATFLRQLDPAWGSGPAEAAGR